MNMLAIVSYLIIVLAIVMLIAIFLKNRSAVVGITAMILVLGITQIIIKWGSAGFADYMIPVLCILHLVYHWKFVKG